MNYPSLVLHYKTVFATTQTPNFELGGLLWIAKESGNLQTVSRWTEGETAYAMSIRSDTGKQLVTMMSKAQYRSMGGDIYSNEFHREWNLILTNAALKQNLETHFEAEIKAAKEAALKQ